MSPYKALTILNHSAVGWNFPAYQKIHWMRIVFKAHYEKFIPSAAPSFHELWWKQHQDIRGNEFHSIYLDEALCDEGIKSLNEYRYHAANRTIPIDSFGTRDYGTGFYLFSPDVDEN